MDNEKNAPAKPPPDEDSKVAADFPIQQESIFESKTDLKLRDVSGNINVAGRDLSTTTIQNIVIHLFDRMAPKTVVTLGLAIGFVIAAIASLKVAIDPAIELNFGTFQCSVTLPVVLGLFLTLVVWLNTGAARGQLIFESQGVEVARIRLNKRRRFQRLSRRDLKPTLEVQRIVVKKAEFERKRRTGKGRQLPLDIDSDSHSIYPGVIITGICNKGKTFRQRLDANVRTSFACAPLTVRYEPFDSSTPSMPI